MASPILYTSCTPAVKTEWQRFREVSQNDNCASRIKNVRFVRTIHYMAIGPQSDVSPAGLSRSRGSVPDVCFWCFLRLTHSYINKDVWIDGAVQKRHKQKRPQSQKFYPQLRTLDKRSLSAGLNKRMTPKYDRIITIIITIITTTVKGIRERRLISKYDHQKTHQVRLAKQFCRPSGACRCVTQVTPTATVRSSNIAFILTLLFSFPLFHRFQRIHKATLY